MGEVWRAKDTRLDREVAVKVLPASFAADAQLRIRFDREARAISSLNHPHICTLFDVGQEAGLDFLVMELIDGESLADRLRKGALPIEQVLRIGSQIATALHAAHRQGIVHRDLKPGNIMLTRSGAKLLDFGLAKSASAATTFVDSVTGVATAAKALTQEGTIVGTFQYMSPEQLEGLEADVRTDIFALGCVLYEMATGKRAFEGSSKTSLIAAIVSSHPAPVTTITPATPPALDHVVGRCLAKDPEDRWQTAHDVAAELQWIANASSSSAIAPLPGGRRIKRGQVAWGIASLALGVALAAGALSFVAGRVPRETLHASIAPPAGAVFNFAGRAAGSLVLSPDGRHLVVGIKEQGGPESLWLRSLATGETKKIAGSEEARYPFWSPDSRWVAFFARDKLMKAERSGAPPVAICDAPSGRGGSWNREGVILFAPTSTGALFRVNASGGEPQPVTTLDAASETTHRWPWFLPDGKRFVYLSTQGSGLAARGTIWLASLDRPGRTSLVQTLTNAIPAAGRLLYTRDGMLLAQQLDLRKESLVGDSTPIASSVAGDTAGTWRGTFTASENGVLAFRSGMAETSRTVTIYDGAGTVVQKVEEPALYASYTAMAFSPDGRRLAIEINDRKSVNDDLWVLELDRGIRTRLTFDPAGEYVPSWSPDGSRIAFSRAEPAKQWYVVVKDVDGSGDETVVYAPENLSAWVTGWSADGQLLACTTQDVSGKRDVVIVPLDGSAPRPFLTASYNEMNPTFSPDGKWLAYVSLESGTGELYVVSWPDGKGKRQISTGGLRSPQIGNWIGNEIRYASADGVLISAQMRPNGSVLEVETQRPLFDLRDAVALAVSSNGSRVAAVYPYQENSVKNTDVVDLIVNWDTALRSSNEN
jgi:eukaryotic-like serine/threonine-protein kinase